MTTRLQAEATYAIPGARGPTREAPEAAPIPLQLMGSPGGAVTHLGALMAAGGNLGMAQLSGGGAPAPGDVHAAAAHGVRGGGGALPHAEAIQRSFGRHDVSGVRAHVGGAAAEATQAMGARAYATGGRVAFGAPPDLHTAAHEAAHVVQQRAGVHLAGGVGRVGDAYERHADAVADRVVAGESAEAILDTMTGGGGGASRAPGAAIGREAAQTAPTVQRFVGFGHASRHVRIQGPEQQRQRALLADARARLDPVLQPRTGWQLVAHYRAPTTLTSLARRPGDPELEAVERRVVREHLIKRYGAQAVHALLAAAASGRLTEGVFANYDARHWARASGAVRASLAAAQQLQTNRMMQQAWIDSDLVARVGGALSRFFAGEARLAQRDLDATRAAASVVHGHIASGAHDAAVGALGRYSDALARFTARYESYFQRLEDAARLGAGVSKIVAGASALIVGGAVVAKVGVAAAVKGLVGAATRLGQALASVQTAVTTAQLVQGAATVTAALARVDFEKKLADLLARANDLPPGGSASVSVNLGPAVRWFFAKLPVGQLQRALAALGKKVPAGRARDLLGTVTADAPVSLSVSVSDSHTFVVSAGGTLAVSAGATVMPQGSYSVSAVGEHIELPKAVAAMSHHLGATLPAPIASVFHRLFGHAASPAGSTRITEQAASAGVAVKAGRDTRLPGRDRKRVTSAGLVGTRYGRDVRSGEARSAAREINVAASVSQQLTLGGVGLDLSLTGTYQNIVRDLNWDNNGEYFNLGTEVELRPFQRALKRSSDAAKLKASVAERLKVLDQIDKQLGPAYENLKKQMTAKVAPLVAKLAAGGMPQKSALARLFKGYERGPSLHRSASVGARWPDVEANAVKNRIAESRKKIAQRVARDLDRLDATQALDVAVTVGVDHYFTKASPGGWSLLYRRVSAGLGVDVPVVGQDKTKGPKKGRKKRGGGAAGHQLAVTAPVHEDIGAGAINYIRQRFMRDSVGGCVWKDPARKTELVRRPWWDAFVGRHQARLHEAFGAMWAEQRGARGPTFGKDFHGVGAAYGGPSPSGRFDAARGALERVFMAELALRQDNRLNADVAEAGRLVDAGKPALARQRLARHAPGRIGPVASAILTEATARKINALLLR